MKAHIKASHNFPGFTEEDRKKAIETMKRTWQEFKDALANGKFQYDETEIASRETFLKVFDDSFQKYDKDHLTCSLGSVFSGFTVGRGANLKDDEVFIAERLNPQAKYIGENRFSPPKIEWLYLALGKDVDAVKECTQKECRAETGKNYRFSLYSLVPEHEDTKIVDLTIADSMSYSEIEDVLNDKAEKAYKSGLKFAKKHGLFLYKINQDKFGLDHDIIKLWYLLIYSKMLSTEIFTPIYTDNQKVKKYEYSPFQTIAKYFEQLGYGGIIYSSTVCTYGKNLVLFNKLSATPTGDLQSYIIP